MAILFPKYSQTQIMPFESTVTRRAGTEIGMVSNLSVVGS